MCFCQYLPHAFDVRWRGCGAEAATGCDILVRLSILSACLHAGGPGRYPEASDHDINEEGIIEELEVSHLWQSCCSTRGAYTRGRERRQTGCPARRIADVRAMQEGGSQSDDELGEDFSDSDSGADILRSSTVSRQLYKRRATLKRRLGIYVREGTAIARRHFGPGRPGAIPGGGARLVEGILLTTSFKGARVQVCGSTVLGDPGVARLARQLQHRVSMVLMSREQQYADQPEVTLRHTIAPDQRGTQPGARQQQPDTIRDFVAAHRAVVQRELNAPEPGHDGAHLS